MAGRSAAVALLLVAAGCASTGPDFARAQVLVQDGRSAAAKGDHRGAIDLYTEALRENPEYPEAFYERGWSHLQLRRSPELPENSNVHLARAFDDYDQAIRCNPAYGDAYFNRAMIHASVGRHKLAAEDLRNATRFNPRDARAHLKLGEIYEQKFEESLPQALEHYEKCVELGGGDGAVREKVRAWREMKKALAPPSPAKAPGPEDEKKAQELHQRAMELFRSEKRDEALKGIEELLSAYSHTQFVKAQERAFQAILKSLRDK